MMFLLACTGPSPEVATEAPAQADPTPAPSRPSSWPPDVHAQTEAFTLAPEPVPHGVVDSVTVHGWTDQGLAWELHHPGMGGASCDMWARLELVGPSATLGVARFEHAQVDGDECSEPSPDDALDGARAAWLSERAVRMGGVGLGGSALVVTGEDLEPMSFEAKAGYTLRLGGHALEREPAEFVWDWQLVQVFWHPEGTMAAALVAGTGMGFEGSYTRYEVQVLPLPPDASVE